LKGKLAFEYSERIHFTETSNIDGKRNLKSRETSRERLNVIRKGFLIHKEK
jgi:hypothetical protein